MDSVAEMVRRTSQYRRTDPAMNADKKQTTNLLTIGARDKLAAGTEGRGL